MVNKKLSLLLALVLVFSALSAMAADEVATETTDSQTVTAASELTTNGSDTSSVVGDTDAGEENAVVGDVASIDTEPQEIEDLTSVNVDEIGKVPSNFGLWWRDVRENLTLAFTWNELDKAERSLKFAEERMRIAKLIAEQSPNDEKAQAKARKMIDKAQRFLDKVEAKKDKWSKDKKTDEVQKLIDDIVTSQNNNDVVLDKLEKVLPEDEAGTVGQKRERMADSSQRLLNALENENIPAETKAHLTEVKDRIETHLEEVRTYNEQRKALQEKARTGDETAKEDLQQLKEERRTQIQVRTEGVEEIKSSLEEKAAAGDASAQKKLDIIKKIEERRGLQTGTGRQGTGEATQTSTTSNVVSEDDPIGTNQERETIRANNGKAVDNKQVPANAR